MIFYQILSANFVFAILAKIKKTDSQENFVRHLANIAKIARTRRRPKALTRDVWV